MERGRRREKDLKRWESGGWGVNEREEIGGREVSEEENRGKRMGDMVRRVGEVGGIERKKQVRRVGEEEGRKDDVGALGGTLSSFDVNCSEQADSRQYFSVKIEIPSLE